METAKPRDVGIDPERLDHFFAVVERLIDGRGCAEGVS